MMTAYRNSTLAQLVAERPGRARVLEEQRLDYCCHGSQKLTDACAEKHIDVAELCDQLTALDRRAPDADDVDLRCVPLPELIEHIVAVHHSYLQQELPRLDRLLKLVNLAHGAQHPELQQVHAVFQSLRAELTSHMQKEEQVLFPWIVMLADSQGAPRPCGSVMNPIHVMEHEHRDAAEALERIRELTGGYQPPIDACESYRVLLAGLLDLERDLHRHVHKENNILFPRADALESAL